MYDIVSTWVLRTSAQRPLRMQFCSWRIKEHLHQNRLLYSRCAACMLSMWCTVIVYEKEIHKILGVWNEISQEEDIFQPLPMPGHILLWVDRYQLLGKFWVWCSWLRQAFLLNLCLWSLESAFPCGLELLGAVDGISSQWVPAQVSVQPGSDSWCPALWPLMIAWWNYS